MPFILQAAIYYLTFQSQLAYDTDDSHSCYVTLEHVVIRRPRHVQNSRYPLQTLRLPAKWFASQSGPRQTDSPRAVADLSDFTLLLRPSAVTNQTNTSSY